MALDLRNCDCMELMAEFSDGHFNLAIIDPPYGINTAKKKSGKGWVQRKSKDWDNAIPSAEYFKELFRISKNQIIWGGNYFTSHLPKSMGWVFWDKGQRNFSLADGELAFTSFNKALRVFEYSRGRMMHDEPDRFHPTQKPIQLYKWLLTKFAKPGFEIIDTHLGSGSIAIACHELGYNLTGSELDSEYFDKMINRIERETAQQSFL